MDSLAFAAVIAVFVVAAVVIIRCEVFCLNDIARAQEVRYLSKAGWTVVCIISIPLGGILYLYLGRPR